MALLVVQNGQTVFEHYANGGGVDAAWKIFSGTKSFWGIAALVAVDEGKFRLDDRVSDTITEWRSDPRKSQITIRQLLSFTDGLEPASFLHRDIPDRNAAALKVAAVARPGSVFAYGPSHLQVFCELLRRKLNGGSTMAYLQAHVTAPLGIGGFEYKQDQKGNPLFASGFQLSARQWIRLGEMILGNGQFGGHQIVPAELLRQAFTGSSANPSYGLTFWINRSSRPFFQRNRHGEETRSALATRQLARHLHLENGSAGHGGRPGLTLPATFRYAFDEPRRRPALLG